MPLARRAVIVALAVYCVALAVALLAPTSTEQSRLAAEVARLGIQLGFDPMTATQSRAEFICNALILMPVSALGTLVWRRTTWRDWTAIAFVLSSAVELTQALFLLGRTPSYTDIVANTLGGLGGAVVSAALAGVVGRRAGGPDRPGLS